MIHHIDQCSSFGGITLFFFETRWNYRRMLDKPFFGMVEETVIGFSRNGHEHTSSLVMKTVRCTFILYVHSA